MEIDRQSLNLTIGKADASSIFRPKIGASQQMSDLA
jgi:hypothetical protein